LNSYLLTILLFIVGALFLFVGIKILLTKKPIIFSNKYPLLLLLILFLSMLILPGVEDFNKDEFDFFKTGLLLLFMIVIFIYIFRSYKGYLIIGVDDDTFRKTLNRSLEFLKMDYDEKLSKIVLDKYDTTIHCSVQSWLGQAQILIKGKLDKNLYKSLISQISSTLKSGEIVALKNPGYFYTVVGIIVLVVLINSFY